MADETKSARGPSSSNAAAGCNPVYAKGPLNGSLSGKRVSSFGWRGCVANAAYLKTLFRKNGGLGLSGCRSVHREKRSSPAALLRGRFQYRPMRVKKSGRGAGSRMAVATALAVPGGKAR